MDFRESDTKLNLMRAFAGESQARNRYMFAAEQAKKDKLYVIQKVFEYTADQEQAHAKVFYDYLKEFEGESICVDGGYPVDIYPNIVKQLLAAHNNEYHEYQDVYKTFGEIAEKEGFKTIAQSFKLIADIEKTHGDRFKKFADYIEEGKLFLNDEKTEWLCLHCGNIHSAKQAPKVCPVCNYPQGYFIRLEMSPFE